MLLKLRDSRNEDIFINTDRINYLQRLGTSGTNGHGIPAMHRTTPGSYNDGCHYILDGLKAAATALRAALTPKEDSNGG